MTVAFLIYLFKLILLLYVVYLIFGTIAQLIDPTFAPRLRKRFNRWIFFRSARKFGTKNAYFKLKNVKDIADALEPWEHAKFRRMKNTIRYSQLLAFVWKSNFMAGIGLYNHPELKIFGRWQFFKEGVIGMLVSWGLLSLKHDPLMPPIEHFSH